ncbi:prolyl oligopeptidase family serine peptidase, partial [Mitsuaria sp. WAJ17]|uniref:alpha/beta hydrolase family protein n=1 Tax=Mitsuaria sp. WAJ17 TaxID=2761452 RepID=UPI0016049F58
LQWTVRQGLVDPQRVCIAGASYGGYATLMGLIKQPELYRCGINWVGVTDIDLLYSIHWSDQGGEWKGYGMPVLVGDREKDAEQLRATSPLQRAGELKRPLLMAYGAE